MMTMSRTTRIPLVLAALALVAGCLVLPALAGEPDDHLACELVSVAKMEAVFGLPHVMTRSKAESPTATSPNDHTVAGSDLSECDVFAYATMPSPAVLLALSRAPGKPNVPSGLGSVTVTTNVRDHTQGGDGESWNALQEMVIQNGAVGSLIKEFGGGKLKLSGAPAGGAAFWIGNKNHAVGRWKVGDGLITINVLAAGGTAPAKLLAVAKLLVPKFAPFATG